MELVVLWIVMGIVVAIVANSKGYSAGGWFLYGALIWPVALTHILVKPRLESALPVPAAQPSPANSRLPRVDGAELRVTLEDVAADTMGRLYVNEAVTGEADLAAGAVTIRMRSGQVLGTARGAAAHPLLALARDGVPVRLSVGARHYSSIDPDGPGRLEIVCTTAESGTPIEVTGPEPAPPAQTTALIPGLAAEDIAGQIAKLAELKSAGALTEDEFARAKRRVLGA